MFCNNLRTLRLKCGLSQKQVADFLNVSPQSVSKWEKGESLPSIEFLPKMAECLDCDINAFFIKEEVTAFHYNEINSYFALQADILNEVKKIEDVNPFLLENPNIVTVITDFCNNLMEYKTVNTKIIQGMLNCGEAKARAFICLLERCEMVEKLDIGDAYFVIKDAVEGIILLIKMHKQLCDVINKYS